MSVFGGDSWAREAQYRKRRVDNLLVEGLDGSSYKKLSSGKYACLVCPNNPILDSPLMLSMHSKGSRHLAAESKLKEKELIRQNEINKRTAQSDNHIGSGNASTSKKNVRVVSKPLIEQTKKAAGEILCKDTSQLNSGVQNCDVGLNEGRVRNVTSNSSKISTMIASDILQQQLDFRERREKELKFTEAGWKRDCHGRWFKDENSMQLGCATDICPASEFWWTWLAIMAGRRSVAVY